MGAKKKGKGSKLARMSDEEKLRYLQHRAAIEEEARRRKEQLIATFMKNKLKREEAFSRLNVAKINQQWRQTLRRYKCIELGQEFEALFKWFVYTASKKTKQIDMLLEDLNEAEYQYSRIQNCHIETVDKLLDIHQERVDFFQRQYEEDRRNVYEKANDEIKKIISSAIFDQDHLKAILYRMDEEHEKEHASLLSKQTIKADELRNNMLTELENLVNSREAKMEGLWRGIQAELKNYWEATEDRRRQYIALRDADLENCKQIFIYHQQINNISAVIVGLKDQLLRSEINIEEQFAKVKKEKEDSSELYKKLRKQFNEDRESDKKKLAHLTTVADSATKELTRVLKKGEQILQVVLLCSKLEMPKDNISDEGVQYDALMNLTKGTEEKQDDVEEEHKEKLIRESDGIFSELDKFWRQYNQVLIDKESLALNIKTLATEQTHLKNALRSYISDAMFLKPSMKIRLTVNRPFTSQPQRSSVNLETKRIFSPVPYVEATQSPSIKRMILIEQGKF